MAEQPFIPGAKTPAAAPAGQFPVKPAFGAGMAQSVSKENLSEFANDISNLNRRLRILEERYSGFRKRIQVTDQNNLKQIKDINKNLKVSESEILDYKREFIDLKDKVKLIVKELKDCAKSDEVRIIQNYIDLWEPINFVTRAEFDRIIEERIKSAISDLKRNTKNIKEDDNI